LLFWYVTQCRFMVTNVSGQPIAPIFKGQTVYEEILDSFTLNVGNWLPIYTVYISQEGIYHLHFNGSLASRDLKIFKPKSGRRSEVVRSLRFIRVASNSNHDEGRHNGKR